MKNTKDSPGVFIPPPLFYVVFFLISNLLQGRFTIRKAFFFHSFIANIIGLIFILTGLTFSIPALRQFIKTKNTVVTIKSASSLLTTGIYSLTRNPMYMGLLFIYLGLAFIFGNWWTIFLLPLLITTVNFLIILPEERYLARAFGEDYSNYKKIVRRWI